MGNGGQMSSNFFTGLLFVQKSRRSRRRGEENTTDRHRLHTCTSVRHPSSKAINNLASSWHVKQTNISRRTSSGSLSTVTREYSRSESESVPQVSDESSNLWTIT